MLRKTGIPPFAKLDWWTALIGRPIRDVRLNGGEMKDDNPLQSWPEPRHRILVADLNAALCRLLVLALQAHGYEVTAVSDGRLALDEVEHHCYNLLLTSSRLTGVNGYDLISELRRRGCEMPIVLHTGSPMSHYLLAHVIQEIDGLISKPSGLQQIVETIRDILARRVMTERPPVRLVA